MPKRIINIFLFLSYVIVAVAILVEVSSQVYVRTLRSDLLVHQEIENYQNFNLVKEWQTKLRPSPYFGYVAEYGNNYGFDSKVAFPIKGSKNSYIIAIAGGSVANQLATYIALNDDYKNKLKKLIPSLKNKDIHFMNLSMPGYRQPQQFFTISYFIEHIDLVIQLDGWNESWIQAGNQFPADFPAFSEVLYSKNISHQVADIQNNKYIIDTIKRNKILSHSLSLLLVRNILQKNINQQSEDLLYEDHHFYGKKKTGDDLKNISISAWAKYLKMEQALLKVYNKKSFFFIQPSQYNENSKLLSEQERKIAIGANKELLQSIKAFKKLRKDAQQLKVWDLVNVFQKTPDDIYIDDCCHVNKKGNQLMADEIFRIVSANF